MFKWLKTNKERVENINQNNKHNASKPGDSLEENIVLLKNIFKNDETVIFRRFENPYNSKISCCIVFINGMINSEIVNENIIQPVVTYKIQDDDYYSLEFLQHKLIISNDVQRTADLDKLLEAIMSGDTVLLLEGSKEALIISSRGWQTRSIKEPDNEKVLRGPREGFTESLILNTTLVRRRLKTANLKFKFMTIGERSCTKACVCYIEGLADEKILNELNHRLSKICIDGVLDSGTIQEFIKDSPLSPFKTISSTERPDIIAAKLLEGRIAFFLDGSPNVSTVPHVFIELFQSDDDYYINFYFSSINRILRFISFIISISVPAIYLSLITFHHEIVPTTLIISIAAARQGVPFPTIVEELGLLLVFEVLREAGTRMPSNIGQALSIVGALVIGQAAVEARFVSAPIVIVVALAGITGLMLPRLKGATIVLRVLFIMLCSVLGLYGFIFGISGLLIHLFGMRSFGIPYMTGFMSPKLQDLKDTAIRAPWWYMKQRPKLIGKKDYSRQSSGEKS